VAQDFPSAAAVSSLKGVLPCWLEAQGALRSETARVHRIVRRRGCMAACGAGAATGDVGDRVPQRWLGCPTAPADLGVFIDNYRSDSAKYPASSGASQQSKMFHATQLNSHAIAGRLTAAATALVASGGSSERKNRPYAKQTTAELRSKYKGRELHEETHGCGRSWGSLGGRLGPGTRPIRPWGPVL
jgi:hypothetical protein